MPKKKKTREQKMRADERKSATSASLQTSHMHVHGTPTYSFATQAFAPQPHQEIHRDTVALVKNDIAKTARISATILALQLLIYILLKNHVLAIGFVSY